MAYIRLAAAIVSISLAAVCVFVAAPAAQDSKKIEYDEFCKLDVQDQERLLRRGESRKPRQSDSHADSALAGQKPGAAQHGSDHGLEENIAFIKADLYKIPRREEDMANAKKLEQRTLALMSREDMTEAFTIFGSCIAKN